MIAHLDDAIGRILSVLDANGLRDNTIVIYTGDHGLSVGQHGLMGKQNVYEHSTRVPLVIAGPGVPCGIVSDALVWHGDTTATIRAFAGLASESSPEGWPLIVDGEVSRGHEHLAAVYAYGQRMIRNERYKLIRYQRTPALMQGTEATDGTDMVQLFDLEADPWETRNLATDPAYAAMLHDLGAMLHAWQVAVDDELLRIDTP